MKWLSRKEHARILIKKHCYLTFVAFLEGKKILISKDIITNLQSTNWQKRLCVSQQLQLIALFWNIQASNFFLNIPTFYKCK